jgi:hypothetical protein
MIFFWMTDNSSHTNPQQSVSRRDAPRPSGWCLDHLHRRLFLIPLNPTPSHPFSQVGRSTQMERHRIHRLLTYLPTCSPLLHAGRAWSPFEKCGRAWGSLLSVFVPRASEVCRHSDKFDLLHQVRTPSRSTGIAIHVSEIHGFGISHLAWFIYCWRKSRSEKFIIYFFM